MKERSLDAINLKLHSNNKSFEVIKPFVWHWRPEIIIHLVWQRRCKIMLAQIIAQIIDQHMYAWICAFTKRHSWENRESKGKEEESWAREDEEEEKRATEGRWKNEQPVTPRSARLGLDNCDVFRAKNRPGTPSRSDCNRRWCCSACIGADMHTGERTSERASERRGRARGSERRGAREQFFGLENVRRGCQPGYLVQHSPRCEARSLRRTWAGKVVCKPKHNIYHDIRFVRKFYLAHYTKI